MMTIWVIGSGCFTRTEGCLDVAASNLDLDADRPCERCCTYPPISVSLTQNWEDMNFIDTIIRHDIQGEPYKIRDLKYFLSSFAWRDAENVVYTIDSTDIACGQQFILYTPDMIMVDSRQFNYTLDSIRLFPSVQSIEFKVGWIPELECVDETAEGIPAVLTNTSPLWDPMMDTRAAVRVVVQLDTATQVFDTVYVHTCQSIGLPYIEDFELGKSQVLMLSVNYALWFANVDVDSLNSFKSSILSGIPGSFSRTP